MPLKKITFAALDRGQVFLSSNGRMYRKANQESADLIRLPSGEEPADECVDPFPPDEIVELVPTRDDMQTDE